MFFFIFCVFCVFAMFCALCPLLYTTASYLFVHKFTDHCHRVETQLQNKIYHIKYEADFTTTMTFLYIQSEPVAANVSTRATAPEPAAVTPTQWLCSLKTTTPKAAGRESVTSHQTLLATSLPSHGVTGL